MIKTTKSAFMKMHKAGKLSLVAAGTANVAELVTEIINTPTKEWNTTATSRADIDGPQNTIHLVSNKQGDIFYLVINDGSANTYPYPEGKKHITIYKYEGF